VCLSTVDIDADGTASPAVIQDNVDVGKETGPSVNVAFCNILLCSNIPVVPIIIVPTAIHEGTWWPHGGHGLLVSKALFSYEFSINSCPYPWAF
jgi:hypothetical protein